MDNVLPPEITSQLERIEQAVDACGKFKRFGEAYFTVSRLGYTLYVPVKPVGVRMRKPFKITGDGETLVEAVDHLVERLGTWSEVLKS